MIICPKCKAHNLDGSTFCSRCGNVMSAMNSASQPEPPASTDPVISRPVPPTPLAHSQSCEDSVARFEAAASERAKGLLGVGGGVGSLAVILYLFLGKYVAMKFIMILFPILFICGIICAIFAQKILNSSKQLARQFRYHCSTEFLSVDTQGVSGKSIQKGDFRLSWKRIKKVTTMRESYPTALGGISGVSIETTLLSIQDQSGITHTFYSFKNASELRSVIEEQCKQHK